MATTSTWLRCQHLPIKVIVSCINQTKKRSPESLEGIEYFVNNPYLKDFYVALILEKPYSVGRLMPRSNITGLVIGKTEIAGGVDLSKATSLGFLILSNCSSITALDLCILRSVIKRLKTLIHLFQVDCRYHIVLI